MQAVARKATIRLRAAARTILACAAQFKTVASPSPAKRRSASPGAISDYVELEAARRNMYRFNLSDRIVVARVALHAYLKLGF